MKTPTLLFAATVLLAQASPARAQTAADSAAIRQASLDYIEGWYAGDAARMERSLHPDLTKRIVVTMPNGTSTLSQMSAMGLVRGTRAGGGRRPRRTGSARTSGSWTSTATPRASG